MTHRSGYVALVGRPNVGKSTLLNRLLGQKLAITSHKPQTTRHSICGVLTRPGMQAVLVDTPGLHRRGRKALNRYLNRTAGHALDDTDLALFVVEAEHWTDEDQAVCERLADIGRPVLAVVNKIDRVKPRELLLPFLDEVAGRLPPGADLIPLSARSGENCAQLEALIGRKLPQAEPLFPEEQITDRPERFFAAELIREQLTRRFHKELPYSLSVEIETFKRIPGLLRINALIWVERETQKGILVGAQGKAMKAAATAARHALEAFFGCRVHLRTWVKVKRSWASDEASLQRLGYVE